MTKFLGKLFGKWMMRSVKSDHQYVEYLIEYDTNLGMYWVSGLTPEDFWIDLYHVHVFDDPVEKVNELVKSLVAFGHSVSVQDITDIDDEYKEDDETANT